VIYDASVHERKKEKLELAGEEERKHFTANLAIVTQGLARRAPSESNRIS
jgi:hypothetical protein